MEIQSYGPDFEPPISQGHDEQKNATSSGDPTEAAELAVDAFDCSGVLDLGCFDVSDCGSLDCVPLDCGF